MDQLNEFKPATKLFEFPPKFEPITAKPYLLPILDFAPLSLRPSILS